ncbi:MAG TPA: ABC-2 family transporter protein [Candidatus Dormibacteraeota bacterium]|nr:ABC-2 family transporter protein [Candidatus Dormibacteraeota bacterium]
MTAVLATFRAAVLEARANRRAFWTQLAAMALNDVVWVIFWSLFFAKVGVVRGWDRSRVLLLLAILTTGGGVVLGLLSNARRIGQLATDGGIDAALALPVRPLAYLLVRRVEAVNFGDGLFGLGLFVIACHPTPGRALVYLLGSAAGAVVLASFLVLVGSITFFTRRGEAGDLGFQAIILLASYPVDIFSGATKVLLYTAIPAAFVAAVPARLVDHLDLSGVATLAGVAALFATGAATVFSLGLRRYTSSSLWTRA